MLVLVALPSFQRPFPVNHLEKTSTMPAFSLSMPSLPIDTISFLDFISQPIAVLIIVTLISLSYKRCKTLNVSPATRQLFIDSHAVATELCQLLLVVLAPFNTAPVIKAIILLVVGNHITAAKAALHIQVLVVGSLLFHSSTIMMVDMIEGWVLLGRVFDAREYQPFFITKICVVSLWRYLTKRTTPQLPEISMPGHDIRALENRMEYRRAFHARLAKLYHLDLAGPDSFQFQCVHAYKLSLISAPTPMLAASSKAQRHAFKELPTPPDSNELRETKRVKWAPTVTVFSPSGNERRGSVS